MVQIQELAATVTVWAVNIALWVLG